MLGVRQVAALVGGGLTDDDVVDLVRCHARHSHDVAAAFVCVVHCLSAVVIDGLVETLGEARNGVGVEWLVQLGCGAVDHDHDNDRPSGVLERSELGVAGAELVVRACFVCLDERLELDYRRLYIVGMIHGVGLDGVIHGAGRVDEDGVPCDDEA